LSPDDTTGPDVRPVRFDRPLVDLASWADPRLARQIAEEARAAREQALAEGYAAGWAQGRRAAAEAERADAAARAERAESDRRQFAAHARTLLTALARTAQELTEQITPAWEELIDVLLDGSLRLAAAGLGRELAAVDAQVLEATRTALRLLPAADAVTLHVNPSDAAVMTASVSDLEPSLSVVRDATVPAGTVVARTALHKLPVDLHAALQRAEEVLRP
jgi:flagellar assembly protein FliH